MQSTFRHSRDFTDVLFPGLKETVRDKFRGKLPEGAIKFPMDAMGNRELDWSEIKRVREQFNLDKLYVVHGVSASVDERGVVIMGPHGVGKSTVLRQMRRRGQIKPIDDGYTIVGRDKDSGEFKVISTGMMEISDGFSRISKSLRSIVPSKSPYLAESDALFRRRVRIGRVLHKASNLIGYLTVKSRQSSVENTATKITGVVYMHHEKDDESPIEIRDGEYSRVRFKEFLDGLGDIQKVRINLPDEKQGLTRQIASAVDRVCR